MKRKVLMSLCFLFCILSNGCAEKMNARIDDLLSNPGLYLGKHICTYAIDVSGFETNGLAESTYEEAETIYHTEPVIWIEGAEIASRTACLRSETLPATEFCQATVCGIPYGANYGHVGAYPFQLRADSNRASGSRAPLDSVSKALYNGSAKERRKLRTVCTTVTVLSGSTGCASRLIRGTR